MSRRHIDVEVLPDFEHITHLPCRLIADHVSKHGSLEFEDLFITGNEGIRLEVEAFFIQKQLPQLAKVIGVPTQSLSQWRSWFFDKWEQEEGSREIYEVRTSRVRLLENLYNDVDKLLQGQLNQEVPNVRDGSNLLSLKLKIIDKIGEFEGSKAPSKQQIQSTNVNIGSNEIEMKLQELIQTAKTDSDRRKLIDVKRRLLTGPDTIVQES